MTAVVGMGTVFSVLIILMLIIMVMEKLFTGNKTPAAGLKTVTTAPEKAKIAPAPEKPAAPADDDEELIAVLTAAVAASLNTSTYNLRIKSYRRIENNSTAWNKAGVRETISSRDF